MMMLLYIDVVVNDDVVFLFLLLFVVMLLRLLLPVLDKNLKRCRLIKTLFVEFQYTHLVCIYGLLKNSVSKKKIRNLDCLKSKAFFIRIGRTGALINEQRQGHSIQLRNF